MLHPALIVKNTNLIDMFAYSTKPRTRYSLEHQRSLYTNLPGS